MNCRWMIAAWLGAAAGVLALVGSDNAAAQTNEKKSAIEKKKQRVAKAANAVPGNHRQLITRYFAAKGGAGGNVLSAHISRPGIWESPLGITAPAPIVCVKWAVPGTFGRHEETLIFRFHEGQIYEALNPETVKYGAGLVGVMLLKSVTCDKLAYGPYSEIVKRQRPKP